MKQLIHMAMRKLRDKLPHGFVVVMRRGRDRLPQWVAFRRIPGGYELRPWYRKYILNRF